MRKEITIAYSPDTDDQFMVLALREKKIDWQGFDFKFIVDDIQVLNDAALLESYDITAISIAAYPSIMDAYILMPIGASVGDEFGPAIVTAPDSSLTCVSELKGKRVAVPGIQTSAHISAQSLFGPFEAVPMYFLDIKDAVLNKEVDAGILIHELQMNPESSGLRKLSDLGRLWFNKYQLPLPLGANAIKRNLGKDTIQKLCSIYKDSILYALNHRTLSIASSISQAAARNTLDDTLGDRYISMYVNHRSLDFQEDTLRSIEKMYQFGSDQGLFRAFKLSDNVVPMNRS